MKTKLAILIFISLAIGLIGGYFGGKLLNSSASEKTATKVNETSSEDTQEKEFVKTMTAMRQKKGKEFDKEFITQMMGNSQNAIEMASLVADRAENEALKKFALYIEKTEPNDITQLKSWYKDWGFLAEDQANDPHTH